MKNFPPLRALYVFAAVGRLGSMTKAAAELGISPGAVSQQIKILEDFLNLKLVARKAAGLELTNTGRAYHQLISKAFLDLQRAQEEITNHRFGDLFVSALPLFASKWLAGKIFEWQQSEPGINVHLEGTTVELHEGAGQTDFRITYADRARPYDSSVPLFTDSLIPVCSPNMIGLRKPLVYPSDLLSCRLLTIDWKPLVHPPPTWRDWFRIAGHECEATQETLVFSLSSLAIDAALEGRGVVLAQHSLVAEEIEAGRLFAPFPHLLRLPSPYVLAWNNGVFDKQGARDLHRWIIGAARRQVLPRWEP